MLQDRHHRTALAKLNEITEFFEGVLIWLDLVWFHVFIDFIWLGFYWFHLI